MMEGILCREAAEGAKREGHEGLAGRRMVGGRRRTAQGPQVGILSGGREKPSTARESQLDYRGVVCAALSPDCKTVVSQNDFQFILMAPFPPFPRRDGMWIAHRLRFDSLATCRSLIPAPCPCRTLHVRKAAHISRPRRTTPTILRV